MSDIKATHRYVVKVSIFGTGFLSVNGSSWRIFAEDIVPGSSVEVSFDFPFSIKYTNKLGHFGKEFALAGSDIIFQSPVSLSPNCSTCDDTGECIAMVCYGGSPIEALVYCPDCGPESGRGKRVDDGY